MQVSETFIPAIRDYYVNEIADSLGRLRPDERAEMELVLKKIDEEEARVLRLYAAGMVTEDNWKHLWQEWEDKRHKLKSNLERLDQTCETYIEDLDHALILIAKLDILYEILPRSDKRELLRNVIERVVVNHEGKIDRLELLPPFTYLRDVSQKVIGRDQS